MTREPKLQKTESTEAGKAAAKEPKTNEPEETKDEKDPKEAPEVSEGFVALEPPEDTGPGDGVTCGGDKPRAYQVDKDGYLRVLADHVYPLVRMHGFKPAPRIADVTERLAK